MANIVWVQPDQTLAITVLLIDSVTPQDHARTIQEQGDIPANWVIAGYDLDFPSEYPQEVYRWVNGQIVVDQAALAVVQAANTASAQGQLP